MRQVTIIMFPRILKTMIGGPILRKTVRENVADVVVNWYKDSNGSKVKI